MAYDSVHVFEIPPEGGTFLTVASVPDPNGDRMFLDPPVVVVFEKEGDLVAVTRRALAVRYDADELAELGDGNAVRGLSWVVGAIATSEAFVLGAPKPLKASDAE